MNINFKLVSACAGGGHYSVDLTPGPTVGLNEEGVRNKRERVADMTTAEKSEWILALHADANNLTLGQVRDELNSGPGLSLVI